MVISKLVKKPIRTHKVMATTLESTVTKPLTIKQQIKAHFSLYSGNEFNATEVLEHFNTNVRRTVEKILVELTKSDYIVMVKCKCEHTNYYRLAHPPMGNPWS